jgi:hypothetical protein
MEFVPCHVISEKDIPYDENLDISSKKEVKRLIKEATALLKVNPNRGDLLSIEAYADYRNDGLYIYDGDRFIDLDTKIDDYGAIPKQFQVIREFPIHYWHGHNNPDNRDRRIVHNSIVWFDHREFASELITNVRYDNELSETKFFLYTSFKYNDKTYYIVVDDPEREDDALHADLQKIRKPFIKRLTSNKTWWHCESNYENNITCKDVLYFPVY